MEYILINPASHRPSQRRGQTRTGWLETERDSVHLLPLHLYPQGWPHMKSWKRLPRLSPLHLSPPIVHWGIKWLRVPSLVGSTDMKQSQIWGLSCPTVAGCGAQAPWPSRPHGKASLRSPNLESSLGQLTLGCVFCGSPAILDVSHKPPCF